MIRTEDPTRIQEPEKYAQVWWTTADLKEFDLSEAEKEDCLATLEEDLQDTMTAAGWNRLRWWMLSQGYKTKKPTTKEEPND